MKRRFCAALMFAVLLTALLAACNSKTLDTIEDAVEQRMDTVEDVVEQRVNELEENVWITPAPIPMAEIPEAGDPEGREDAVGADTLSSGPQSSERTEMLTKEEAETIALKHAGLAAAEVSRLHTGYEVDDGVPEYDVQFYYDRWEYEYEIHAYSGRILSFEKDD